jgi:hypothetical protein
MSDSIRIFFENLNLSTNCTTIYREGVFGYTFLPGPAGGGGGEGREGTIIILLKCVETPAKAHHNILECSKHRVQ